MSKNSNKKGTLAIVLVLAMACTAIFSSFAYFTDRETAQVEGKAGTVDISLTSNVALVDEDGKNILNPGDKRTAAFTVSNEGNKSVDVRETIILTSSVAMTEVEDQAEFEVYAKNDITCDENKGCVANTGAKPLGSGTANRELSADGKKITYKIDGITLDGKSVLGDYTDAELDVGTNAATAKTSSEGDYVIVFRGTSGNAFQGATLTVDVLAEAKQHRNTQAGWDIVAQESYTFAGNDIQAVPAK